MILKPVLHLLPMTAERNPDGEIAMKQQHRYHDGQPPGAFDTS